MPRILGIDYGTRRIGLAISDESKRVAFPYQTLDAQNGAHEALRAICKKEDIERIVVGLPRGLKNMQATEMTKKVRLWTKELEGLEVPIVFVDEFFSTKEASLLPTKKNHIDQAAATIILQSFLDSTKGL